MIKKPIQNFQENLGEVKALLLMHEALTGEKRGRRDSLIQVLNKSSVVLLVACWEAFIEDLADKAFSSLLTKASSPDHFPKEVQKRLSKHVKEDKNDLKVLELAGNGWKSILKEYKITKSKKFLGEFNTPSPKNIDDLFSDLIGLDNLSKSWSWYTITPTNARRRLQKFIKLRGTIAHKVKSKKPVHKGAVETHMDFLQKLANYSNERVNRYLGDFDKKKKVRQKK